MSFLCVTFHPVRNTLSVRVLGFTADVPHDRLEKNAFDSSSGNRRTPIQRCSYRPILEFTQGANEVDDSSYDLWPSDYH